MSNVLLAAFTAVEGAHAYSAFLPSIFTIRSFRSDETKKAIRDGEIVGTAFTLALGYVVSRLVKSNLPLYFAAGTAVIMIGVYEWALKT